MESLCHGLTNLSREASFSCGVTGTLWLSFINPCSAPQVAHKAHSFVPPGQVVLAFRDWAAGPNKERMGQSQGSSVLASTLFLKRVTCVRQEWADFSPLSLSFPSLLPLPPTKKGLPHPPTGNTTWGIS